MAVEIPEVASVPSRWDAEADVVVVGFGGAGACAAIEAREQGASVLVLDRFAGGGATAISGGVVYAGGGTSTQHSAAVPDSVEDMFAYLSLEVGDCVSPETLRRFCEESTANHDWLAAHGVPFEPSLCPVKTSYPSNDYYLYYSGNESFAPFRDAAKPAARGHRAKGKGLPGASFYAPLRASAVAAGAEVWTEAQALRLVVDAGRVVGVEVRVLQGWAARRHRFLAWLAIKVNPYNPGFAKRCRRTLSRIEQRSGETRWVRARSGVALTAGGFVYNREMVEQYAPKFRPGMPLGTTGCSGDGILLGQSAGGAVHKMDQVSAWRFINPPEAMVKGVLVDRTGARYVNERLYGAQVGRTMVEEHNGEGLLIIDQKIWDEARAQCRRGTGIHWFQQAPALINLYANRRVSDSIAGLAKAARIDPAGLEATVASYNAVAAGAGADAFGKSPEFVQALGTGPFYAIDCGLRSKRFPCPTLTLGGLVVDEASGQVRRKDGSPVEGLYAAGRSAVGVCSNGYVSGLSLADCVFSGRRVGASLSRR